MRRWGMISVVLLSCWAVLPVCAAPKQDRVCETFVLEQTSGKLGPMQLILAKDGGKFVARGGNLVAVCRAPEWRLSFYNVPRKLEFSCDYAAMRKRSSGIFAGPPFDRGKYTYGLDPKYGVHTETLKVDGKYFAEGRNDSLFFQVRQKKQFSLVRYIAADQIPLDPHVQIFIKWLFSNANRGGVPLEYDNAFTDGSHEAVYTTSSVTKRKLPFSTFSYPTGLKPCAKILDVAMMDDPRQTLEELFAK